MKIWMDIQTSWTRMSKNGIKHVKILMDFEHHEQGHQKMESNIMNENIQTSIQRNIYWDKVLKSIIWYNNK